MSPKCSGRRKGNLPGRVLLSFFFCLPGIAAILLPAAAGGGSLFPEVAGWKQKEAPQIFSPENLYEYIDGAADLYLAYGFQELQVAEYAGEGEGLMIVEIYRQATPLYAFGIYSQERLPGSLYLEIGDQGYWEQGVFNFLSGRYYVKITDYKPGGKDREILQMFAEKVNTGLGPNHSLPRILAVFPPAGKKKNTEKFIAKNFLGYSFFPSGFQADYEVAGKKFKLFVIDGKDAGDCRRMIAAYLQYLGNAGKDFRPGLLSVADPNHGRVDLSWEGKHIWGALNLEDADLRAQYLRPMEKELQKFP